MSENPHHSPLPRLPTELWLEILSHVRNTIHLWTTCRQVSTGFRYAVEKLFADKYIKKKTDSNWHWT
ncbi:hypothetical protein K432DRAFT_178132 [Lepidopterella palustris CBS 459.81]|uniref:F-box domain-containing protein n=1 Tax=Lepidopterella palustris CBS 459.81 TaxID=1314670 RepID=A0A8E2JIN6_9PEZI|nr:hypothetical protein K432DRAFT_178132 [Lepidopterella palustris CBS 459.81]